MNTNIHFNANAAMNHRLDMNNVIHPRVVLL